MSHSQSLLDDSFQKLSLEPRVAPTEEEASTVDPDDVSDEEVVANPSPPLKRKQQKELFEARWVCLIPRGIERIC